MTRVTIRKRGPSRTTARATTARPGVPLAGSASSERGLTLIEILLVIVLIATMSAFAIPRISDGLMQQDVQSARAAFVGMYAQARYTAIQRGSKTQLILVNNVISIRSDNPVTNVTEDVGNPVDLNSRYGVALQPLSGTWTFDSRGLGSATEQSTVAIANGTYSTQIVISPAGRVIQ